MADRISNSERSKNMARIRSRNTRPEIAVRHLLHGLGYRYRLHQSGLPGRPDLVFQKRKKAIFVHGCFWHQHNCPAGRLPKTNVDFWTAKLTRNVERDRQAEHKLRAMGWEILAIWECEVARQDMPDRLKDFLGPPKLALEEIARMHAKTSR